MEAKETSGIIGGRELRACSHCNSKEENGTKRGIKDANSRHYHSAPEYPGRCNEWWTLYNMAYWETKNPIDDDGPS